MRRADPRPPPSAQTEARAAALAWLATAMQEARTVATVAELRRAGIASIVLKGPSTRQRLYDPDDVRPTDDADLLVAPRDLRRAGSVLAELGYERQGSNGHADTWAGTDGCYVDLHLTLPFAGRAPRDVWRILAARTVDLVIEPTGERVPVLDPPAHFVHLAVHSLQSSGAHARPVEELRRAVQRFDPTDQLAARAVAAELGLLEVLDLALRQLDDPLDAEQLAARLPSRTLVPGGTWSFLRSSVSWHERRRALVRCSRFFWADEWLEVWLATEGQPVPAGSAKRSVAKVRRLATVARRSASPEEG